MMMIHGRRRLALAAARVWMRRQWRRRLPSARPARRLAMLALVWRRRRRWFAWRRLARRRRLARGRRQLPRRHLSDGRRRRARIRAMEGGRAGWSGGRVAPLGRACGRAAVVRRRLGHRAGRGAAAVERDHQGRRLLVPVSCEEVAFACGLMEMDLDLILHRRALGFRAAADERALDPHAQRRGASDMMLSTVYIFRDKARRVRHKGDKL